MFRRFSKCGYRCGDGWAVGCTTGFGIPVNSRFQSAFITERLPLLEPLSLSLADAGPLTLFNRVRDPADRRECPAILAGYGHRFNWPSLGPEHGAHGVITKPLLDSS